MLYQASVAELKNRRLSKEWGHIVICMRYYPRYLSKNLSHEYQRCLAPDEALFEEFRLALEQMGDHNAAFEQVRYEERFQLTQEGLVELARLSELARVKDVYLLCQCEKAKKCHRHLLLLLAQALFQAPVERVRIEYPLFAGRISSFQ